MRKLDRYIAWNVFAAMVMVLIILVVLESLFSFLAQLDDMRGNYQFMDVIVYTLLMIPKKIYEFIPVSALIGCLAGLGSMAANSELVVMRASGVSLWRMVWSIMKPALLLVVIGITLGEYVAPMTEQIAETRKAIARSTNGEYSGEGVWHREGNEYMYFNAVEPNGVLYGVSRFVFDDNKKLIESSFAKRAIYQQDHWILEDVTSSRKVGDRIISSSATTMPWETSLTTTLLKVVVVRPDALSISGLHTYTEYLKEQGLDTGEYSLAFWTKALQPLSVFSLVLVGISFVFGPLRSVSMGFRIFSGVITGVAFMIIQNLLGPSSLVFGFPPLISVMLPVMICIFVGWLLLWRAA
ncbi:LPS export ABC transporter permease LptG [Endozoicomonas sp. OPT23]|uniref:LPS export ABC transporter permease LptG n=1 Tax=Endozoicomonas sp. OPT23 TaxID=2072845 RepID=UPI00129AB8B0|nr:LPS export ABC transporter permease LptG [Endozoicomonas sp. OPT23]MRI34581.1 LPS export ABC transporter permease LptG [Endozoicomonas sp. OPT23]